MRHTVQTDKCSFVQTQTLLSIFGHELIVLMHDLSAALSLVVPLCRWQLKERV